MKSQNPRENLIFQGFPGDFPMSESTFSYSDTAITPAKVL